jgi:ComF family protein
MVNGWLARLADALYPPRCALCTAPGQPGLDLCPDCEAGLPRNTACCARCALPLPGAPPGTFCGRCQRRPPRYHLACAPLLYRAPVDGLILRLKFGHALPPARLLGELLAKQLQLRTGPLPGRILPVPLHPRRLRERGFNQALEIARVPARHFGVPLDAQSLIRVRDTATQSTLPARQRHANVRHAFAVTRPMAGLHVALVDDVMTTGQTVNAAAHALRQAGVARVEVWCAARVAP